MDSYTWTNIGIGDIVYSKNLMKEYPSMIIVGQQLSLKQYPITLPAKSDAKQC